MSRRGLTLAEAVVSIFLMLFAFVVMGRLLMTGLRYERLVDNEQNAVFLAELQLEKVRGWSAKNHTPAGALLFSDWSACPGQPGPVTNAAFPGYEVAVNSTVVALYSPCSTWELQYPVLADRRVMSQSCRRVRVTVKWSDQTYQLESLVCAPAAPAAATVGVSVTGPSNIARDAGSNYTASATGPTGTLPDVLFSWYVYGVGNGTLLPYRDGSQARLGNYMQDAATPANTVGYGSGNCLMRARARVRGKEVFGDSSQITLP